MFRRPMWVLVALAMVLHSGSGARADLVSEWRLDANAEDAKGTNHGTLVGGPQGTTDRYGDPGRALAFDGKDDSIACGSVLSFGDGKKDRPFSICAWVKMDTHKGFAIASKAGEYSLGNNNHFRLCLRDRSRDASIGRSAGMLARYEGKWVHLAGTYDGSGSVDGITMYIDGAAQRSRKEIGGHYVAMENLGGAFKIGSGWRHAAGCIDDVRVYDHVLTPAEVATLADYIRGAAALRLPALQPGTPGPLTIARAASPPTIDGDLSDAVWTRATWHSGFCVHGSPRQPAVPKTSFAVVHDGDHLYIGLRADEPEPTKMRALVATRDGASWTDDSIEIFLDSKGDARSHYHFAVNTRGALYDSHAVRGGGMHNPKWDSSARAAARVGPDAWCAEVAVPFSCLAFDPEHPTTWRLNIGRSRFVTGSRELSTFAPVRKTFHDTGNFAVAHVADADLAPFLGYDLELRRVRECLRQGRWTADVELAVALRSSRPRQADLRATLRTADHSENVVQRLQVGQGTHNCRLTIPISAGGAATLDLSLQDPASQRVVCSRRFSLVLDCRPLKVELLRPHYQNAIFAGQGLDAIELDVEVALDRDERPSYAFEFVLQSDRDILRSEQPVAAAKAVVSVPLPRLEAGRYAMRGRLLYRPNGKVLGEWREALRQLPPRKGEVRFDAHGACLVDNEPFLPFGLAGDWWPTGIWDAVALGCNAIENCSITLRDEEMPFIDELHQAGLKLLVYPYPRGFPIPVARRTGPAGPLTHEQEQALRSHVRQRKHHPAILAWYTGNEPYPDTTPPATMKQIHEIIADEDPYHPTVIINHNINHIAGNVDAMALVMPDPYPGFLEDGGWSRPDFPTEAVQEAIRASRGRKPVWAVLQAHDGTLFGLKRHRAPSFTDLRNQLHQAAAAGAKGFFWYCRYWIEPHVEIGLAYLAKETAVLREAILAPESAHEFVVTGPGAKEGHVHVSRRAVGPDAYLFAVSSLGKARDIGFHAAALTDRPLFVVGEARAVEVRTGEFVDHFEPFATHVYTTSRRVAEQLHIAAALNEIDAAARLVAKPGNLAHKSRGTTVEVSRQPPPNRCPPAERAIDGSRWSWWKSWGGLPHGVDIVFAQPETIARVVIDSNISHVEVQAQSAGVWTKLAEATSTRDDTRREVQILRFPAVNTSRLRVLSRAVKAGRFVPDSTSQVWEIEAYGGD